MSILLITGPMFSQKSKFLISEYESALWKSNTTPNPIAFVPEIDTRSDGEIVTRVEGVKRIKAQKLTTKDDFQKKLDKLERGTTIVIDEAQFLESGIIREICFREDGFRFIIASLWSDFQQKTFENTQKLANFAEKTIFLTAKCCVCGEENATNTIRKSGASNERILVGSDMYDAICPYCLLRNWK